MDEAQRQRTLLSAIDAGEGAGLREQGARAARGLEAYRANAESIAERALAAAFPTVQALIGPEAFATAARAFWRDAPPQRGDLGEWGDGFPAWLQALLAMADWPYLGDCARLDIALHRCERAADASLDAASLALLGGDDAERLHIGWMPGTALLRSDWPIASIHRAHQLEGADADAAFEAVRAAIAAQRGESALVVRQGWRAVVHLQEPAAAAFAAALLGGSAIGPALEVAGPAFDFAAWLEGAVRQGWLKGVSASPD